MGVTIHFEGTLRDEESYAEAIRIASKFASARGWPVITIACEHAKLLRVRDEQDWDYEGPTRGIELRPHPNCEPLRLEFDRDLYVQEYTKTQFAPVSVHEETVELLEALRPCFTELFIGDEGEFHETRDRSRLEHHRARCIEVLQENLAADSTLRGPVRLPSGRIADLVSQS